MSTYRAGFGTGGPVIVMVWVAVTTWPVIFSAVTVIVFGPSVGQLYEIVSLRLSDWII
jgi:hypothetical protein